MIKQLFLFAFFLIGIASYSQSKLESKSKAYSFTMPANYVSQPSNNLRNEFVFVSKADTTSLVVNVNERPFDKEGLQSFKEATNAEVEKNYFKVLQSPKIMARGELITYKERTIFFHVSHGTASAFENDYMLTFLFYSKGKEINFIFRTKEGRLKKVLPVIQGIVDSVILAD